MEVIKETYQIIQVLDRNPKISSDGNFIVFESWRDNNSEIYIVDNSGENLINISNNPSEDIEPSFTPDGQIVVFTSLYRTGTEDIFSSNIDGSDLKNITNSDSLEFSPNVSPDGKSITYTYQENYFKTPKIYTMHIDGSNKRRLTDHSDYIERLPKYSSLGSKIIFLNFKDLSNGISVRDSSGENLREIVPPPYINSPDNFRFDVNKDDSKIVFENAGEENGIQIFKKDIYIQDFVSGSGKKNLTKSPSTIEYSPCFTPDDNKIVFISLKATSSSISTINVNGTEKINIISFSGFGESLSVQKQ